MDKVQPKKRIPSRNIIIGIIIILIVLVILITTPVCHKSTGLHNGEWITLTLQPVGYIGQGNTTSSSGLSKWTSPCYNYYCGNNTVVSSQEVLVVGSTYTIKGQIKIVGNGTIWLIEQAKRGSQ
jgi:hypothetical protein